MAQLKDDCFAFGGELLKIDVALRDLESQLNLACAIESVPIVKAFNRIAAKNIISSRNVPPNNNSAVDGFLVFSSDLNHKEETRLPVVGRITAGHPSKTKMRTGEAVKIFTGAPIPTGVRENPDTIFMEEDCKLDESHVILPPGLKKGSNRREMGEDIKSGQVIIERGHQLRSQDVALIASIGQAKVYVYKPLRVAVFSTGDEIYDPNSKVPEGCIFDANRFAIIGLLNSLGCEISDLGILPDNRKIISKALMDASLLNDLIITSGGVSAGEEDHVREAVETNGNIKFWRFAIKPGRPVAIGQVAKTKFIGLPGNPVAAMITFMMIARPMIKLLSGLVKSDDPRYKIQVNFDYRKKPGRREWIRSKLTVGKNGNLIANKFENSGSGILTSMTKADGLVEIGELTKEVNKGDYVNFLPFSEIMQ